MTPKWYTVALSIVVFYGSGLIGMDIPKKKPEQKNSLSCSAEFRKTQPAEITALSRSMEMRMVEKEAQQYMYFPHCSGNTPVECYDMRKHLRESTKPYLPYPC